jgi:threonine/homoserine/homoserine lactone efflux protein
MNLFDTLAFAGIFLVLAATPGPGVFATVARALASGFSHGAFVALGIVAGDLVYLLLAVYGLAAMAQAMGELFILVQYAGGAYLLWLGFRIWTAKPAARAIAGIRDTSWKSNFSSGLLVTLGNPKAILFYLGFLPTFVDLNHLSLQDVLLIATIIILVLGSVMLAYAYAAGEAGKLLTSGKTGRIINGIAGSIMLATGMILLLKTGTLE